MSQQIIAVADMDMRLVGMPVDELPDERVFADTGLAFEQDDPSPSFARQPGFRIGEGPFPPRARAGLPTTYANQR
jgi:hypothetical protein